MQTDDNTCGGCGMGLLVEIRKLENGRRVFNCNLCEKNECFECSICHNPRASFAGDDICICCWFAWTQGEIILSEKQIAEIMKWRVAITLPNNSE